MSDNCLNISLRNEIEMFTDSITLLNQMRFVAKKISVFSVRSQNCTFPYSTLINTNVHKITIHANQATTIELTDESLIILDDESAIQYIRIFECSCFNIDNLKYLQNLKGFYINKTVKNVIGNLNTVVNSLPVFEEFQIESDRNSVRSFYGDTNVLRQFALYNHEEFYFQNTINMVGYFSDFAYLPPNIQRLSIGSIFYNIKIEGTIDDYVNKKRELGYTDGIINVWLKNTNVMYKGYYFVEDVRYDVSWTQDNINVTRK